jgi:hypothetical protein
MKREPRAARSLPSVRPHVPIDRLQAAVLAAMRRQALRDRLAREVLVKDPNRRSET